MTSTMINFQHECRGGTHFAVRTAAAASDRVTDGETYRHLQTKTNRDIPESLILCPCVSNTHFVVQKVVNEIRKREVNTRLLFFSGDEQKDSLLLVLLCSFLKPQPLSDDKRLEAYVTKISLCN